MDAATIISGAYEALSSERVGRKWVREFTGKITGEDLRRAAERNFDPITALINEFQLYHPDVRKVATLVLRRYWKDISSELRSVPKIVKRLSANPANREALKDPKVLEWLNVTVQRAYNVLFLYSWPPPVDLKCAYCNSVFPFDILRCTQMQLEGEGKRVYVVQCPNCGREVQVVL
jgi:hypothetical protein